MTSRRDVGVLNIQNQLILTAVGNIINTGTLTLPTSTDTLVARNTTDTLTNKTLTAPVIATIVNVGTLTLPTSTDTLVARNTTDTLTNKTLTAPKIDKIVDTANSTDVVVITGVASGVNQVTVTNATTTNPPIISATGTDANIDLSLIPKGTGNLILDGLNWPTADGSAGQALTTDGAGNLVFASVPSQTVDMVTTADATPTTLSTLTTMSNTIIYVQVEIVARNTTDSSTGAVYKLVAGYKNTGGTLTQIGVDDKLSIENTTSWDVSTSVSGTDILIRVTGQAGTNISWMGYITKLMN